VVDEMAAKFSAWFCDDIKGWREIDQVYSGGMDSVLSLVLWGN